MAELAQIVLKVNILDDWRYEKWHIILNPYYAKQNFSHFFNDNKDTVFTISI